MITTVDMLSVHHEELNLRYLIHHLRFHLDGTPY